jgi:CTP:molybdopterin cytidylyltransferase MocA
MIYNDASMISAVLLAAGESVRMRAFKQLLPFAGKTVVECCVDALLASPVDQVLVVTGYRADDVRHVLGQRPVRLIHNEAFREGMASSIVCGVRSALPDTRAVLIALVDQPTIESSTIGAVVDSYLKEKPLIVVPTFDGKNGHPVLLDMSLRDEVIEMDQTRGLRHVVHAHSDQTLYLEVGTESILRDIDFPEDYERLRR